MLLGRVSLGMIKLSTVLKTSPYLITAGAIVLFALGYVSHHLLGDDNAVEEISEELLKNNYNINVEFSSGHKGIKQ